LELYGTNVFQVMGGYSGFFVYFRPMSVTKVISYQKEDYLDKSKMEEKGLDVSVRPEYLDVRIFADNELLKINSITPVEEYGGTVSITGYIVQVDAPKEKSDKPYVIFRVEAENKEFNEKGENLYFYEIKDYK
ncbi:MAG: carboxypeptidase regulatory-like domain-containing protein, partial [Tannerella sp.]|nr:carboxypeptidase regulatory-like domain-containing protein [Tannerella sp.]